MRARRYASAESKKRSMAATALSRSLRCSSAVFCCQRVCTGSIIGQCTMTPASALAVRSMTVHPSRRMALAWPPTTPPCGKTCAIRMPALRATGGRSLSGLVAVAARISAWNSPNSVVSSVASTCAVSMSPSVVALAQSPGVSTWPGASMTYASGLAADASIGSAPSALTLPPSNTTHPSVIGMAPGVHGRTSTCRSTTCAVCFGAGISFDCRAHAPAVIAIAHAAITKLRWFIARLLRRR